MIILLLIDKMRSKTYRYVVTVPKSRRKNMTTILEKFQNISEEKKNYNNIGKIPKSIAKKKLPQYRNSSKI